MGRKNKEEFTCRDSRDCCLKNDKGLCTALTEVYEKDGDCPFCKESMNKKGERVPKNQQGVVSNGKPISAQGFIDKRIKLSARNEKQEDCVFYLGKKRLCKATHNESCKGCGFYSPNHAKRTEALAQHLYKQEKREIEMRDEIRAQNDTIFELGGMINQLEEKNDRIKPYAQIGKSIVRYAKRRKQA